MDREKVIKGLEVCFDSSKECNGCPYIATPYCKTTLRNDVTVLLKEQEETIRNLEQEIRDKNERLKERAEQVDAMLKEQKAKTGHWVSVNDGDTVAIDNDGSVERACYCSECQKYLIASDEYAVYGRYCPFCGAKMEGR